MGRARLMLLLTCTLLSHVIIALASDTGIQVTRQLQQADPFSQFLDSEPAAAGSGGDTASNAPGVNTAGVPAAASSATTVPVLGSPYSAYGQQQQAYAAQQAAYQQQLAAQQQAAYQQQLAAQQQGAVARPPVANPLTAGVQPAVTAQPATTQQPAAAQPAAAQPAAALPATAAQPAAAAAQPTAAVQPNPAVQPITALQPAAAVQPATAAQPAAAVSQAAAPALPAQPGVDITQPLYAPLPAAAASAPGAAASTTAALPSADAPVSGPATNSAAAAAAEPTTSTLTNCPDSRQPCPGSSAVSIVSRFANTVEQFKAQQAAFSTEVAKALSVSPEQVVVINVKLLGSPQPAEPADEEPTSAVAATKPPPPAAAAAATKPAAAAPSTQPAPAANATKLSNTTKPGTPAGALKPESAPVRRMSRLLRRLLANTTAKAGTSAATAVGPTPLIEVTSSIQPLTAAEAEAVQKTASSPTFLSGLTKALSAADLTLTGDIAVKAAEPTQGLDAAGGSSNSTSGGVVPSPQGATGVAAANGTADTTTPAARSSATSSSLQSLATAAAVVMAAVMAL